MIFYVSDELPALLLFTIYSALVLFWAELYLIAADNMAIYERVLHPCKRSVQSLFDEQDIDEDDYAATEY